MERACDEGLVEDYSISQSSLEQVRRVRVSRYLCVAI